MTWKTTWVLLGSAVLLFAYIYLVERHTRPAGLRAQPPPRLLSLQPEEVTSLQLRRTNQFLVRVDRANGSWQLTAPLAYPAQKYAIENLLQALTDLSSQAEIPLDELAAGGKSLAEFGLDVPVAALTILQGNRRSELLFGRPTPAPNLVYAMAPPAPGIHVISAEVFQRLPLQPNDWRDLSLVDLAGLNLDRIEVRSPGRGYVLALDPTNRVFYLSKPTPARAAAPKVEALLRQTVSARILEFVSDDPRAELERYGLEPPALELVLGWGTNDLALVQFGRSPTNHPGAVYARRLSHTNIVMVARSLLDYLPTHSHDLRDRHLFSFAPEAVDTLEVTGPEGFTARRQFSGQWVLVEPQATPLDVELTERMLFFLSQVEGEVEKDVVTDLAAYGLAPPLRSYLLKTTITNLAGVVTNRLVSQLDLGQTQGGTNVFVRRLDEPFTVYTLDRTNAAGLPITAWQLRHRRVWSFLTNQITRVTIRQHGLTRQFLRSPAGEWSLAQGSTGIIHNTFALEETVYRLGELRAQIWVARGDAEQARYGFQEEGHRLSFELKNGDQTQTLTLDFGGFSPHSGHPYARTDIAGEPWIFEFPLPLYHRILLHLSNPAPRSAVGP